MKTTKSQGSLWCCRLLLLGRWNLANDRAARYVMQAWGRVCYGVDIGDNLGACSTKEWMDAVVSAKSLRVYSRRFARWYDRYIYIYIGSIELKSAVFLHGHSAQVGTTHHGTRRVPLYRYPLWKQRVLIEKMMILGAFGHGFGKTFRFQHTHAMLWRWTALVDTQCFAKNYNCHLGEEMVVQSGTCPKHQIFRLVSSS